MRVDLIDIKKDFGQGDVLNISAVFKPGITVLLGPNGSGKTSLLRIMAGLDMPDEGRYLLEGMDLYRYAAGTCRVVGIEPMMRVELALRCGYMPQSNIMSVPMKVGEAMEYLASMRGTPARRRVEPLMEEWRLKELTHQPLAVLSPGQRRRFLIAQSLLTDPKLWLLDEPTSGLAPEERQAMLRVVASRSDCITVMATHILDDIAVADRVMILKKGYVAWYGTLSEFINYGGYRDYSVKALEQVYMKALEF